MELAPPWPTPTLVQCGVHGDPLYEEEEAVSGIAQVDGPPGRQDAAPCWEHLLVVAVSDGATALVPGLIPVSVHSQHRAVLFERAILESSFQQGYIFWNMNMNKMLSAKGFWNLKNV